MSTEEYGFDDQDFEEGLSQSLQSTLTPVSTEHDTVPESVSECSSATGNQPKLPSGITYVQSNGLATIACDSSQPLINCTTFS